jgi:hypothetical protein
MRFWVKRNMPYVAYNPIPKFFFSFKKPRVDVCSSYEIYMAS